MNALPPTPWQTVGPYFHYSLPGRGCADLTGEADIGDRADLFMTPDHRLPRAARGVRPAGEVVTVRGVMRDSDGKPVPDALIEIWQADPDGRYADGSDASAFIGFGRTATGPDGAFEFRTMRPGAPSIEDAPHIALGVLGTGLTTRLVTRLYFDGDPRNAADPVLRRVPPSRRETLLAQWRDGVWRFDIVLSGENETVFFDIGPGAAALSA